MNNSINVCVVTNSELDWDCVVGVWRSEEEAVKELAEGDEEVTKAYLEYERCHHFEIYSV